MTRGRDRRETRNVNVFAVTHTITDRQIAMNQYFPIPID
jgi:Cytochrome P450